MVYKYEFSKFLDSPDIRNYNQNREFAPAEQSVLIVMGQRQSVDEKLMALKYL